MLWAHDSHISRDENLGFRVDGYDGPLPAMGSYLAAELGPAYFLGLRPPPQRTRERRPMLLVGAVLPGLAGGAFLPRGSGGGPLRRRPLRAPFDAGLPHSHRGPAGPAPPPSVRNRPS